MKTIKYFQFIFALSFLSMSLNGQTATIETPKENKLYKEIAKTNNIDLCKMYLDAYPEGKKSNEVEGIMEKVIYINAFTVAAEKYSDTALQNYLKLYPKGIYSEKAMDAIEVAAWQKAHSENTFESYTDYLKKYPNGKASKIAEDKLEAMK